MQGLIVALSNKQHKEVAGAVSVHIRNEIQPVMIFIPAISKISWTATLKREYFGAKFQKTRNQTWTLRCEDQI